MFSTFDSQVRMRASASWAGPEPGTPALCAGYNEGRAGSERRWVTTMTRPRREHSDGTW